jgi:pimeloyl-ACP methyl ester carboxylesterase
MDQGYNVYHSDVANDTYLVFLHGLGGQIPQFESQLQHFSQYYNVIGIDIVGHGKSVVSGNESDYRIERIVYTVYTILEHLKVIDKKLILVCHSFGCLIGNLLSLKLPIQGMIAIAPKTTLSEKECAKAHKLAKLPIWCLEVLRFMDRFAGTHSPSVNRMVRPKASLVHRRKQLAFNLKTPTKVIRNMLRGLQPIPQTAFQGVLPKLAIVCVVN